MYIHIAIEIHLGSCLKYDGLKHTKTRWLLHKNKMVDTQKQHGCQQR